MAEIALVILFVILSLLILVVGYHLIRGFRRDMRYAAKDETFVPFEDVTPPLPLVMTPGVRIVAGLVLLWSVLNVIGAALLPVFFGWWVLGSVHLGWIMGYVIIASLLGAAGAGRMMANHANGRKLIGWGYFLLGLVSFCGAALALLLLPGRHNVPEEVRRAAIPAGCILGVHLAVTVLLGSRAQTVGKPRETPPPEPPPPLEPPPPMGPPFGDSL